MFESSLYLVFIYAMGILFLVVAVVALYWCARNGQLRNFEKGARVIFTEDEPGGVHRDVFPGKKGRKDMQWLAQHEQQKAADDKAAVNENDRTRNG